jgi:hypothetical protein
MSKQFDEFKANNFERYAMLVAAIGELQTNGEAITEASLQAALPKIFALDMTLDHVAEIVAAESGVVTGKIAAKENGDGAVAYSNLDDEPAESPDQLRQRVAALDAAAADLRAQVYSLRNKLQTARSALADAISAFTHGFGPRVSQQDNVRAELAASLANRAAQSRNPNVAPPPVFGPSILDRSAGWQGHASGSSGDGTDFLHKQMRVGFRRGAAPASRKGAATRLIPSGR